MGDIFHLLLNVSEFELVGVRILSHDQVENVHTLVQNDLKMIYSLFFRTDDEVDTES
jgi:hypothetical protein